MIHSILLSLALAAPAEFAEFAGGELLASFGVNNRVMRYAPSGAVVGELVFPANPDFTPQSVAIGPDGRAYVSSLNDDKIVVFDGNGAVVDEWTDADMLEPKGLAFDSLGRLLVACEGSNRVLVFELDGDVVDSFRTFAGEPAMNKPNTVAVSPSGHVYTNDPENNLVFEFDSSGNFVRSAQCGCGNGFLLTGLEFGWNGHLFANCVEDDVVKELDENLVTARTIGSGATIAEPVAVAFGGDGVMYVASAPADRIDMFGHDGVKIGSFPMAQTFDGMTDLAFVPFRFGVRLKGTLVVDGEMRVGTNVRFDKESGDGAVLAVDPGRGGAFLVLADGAGDDGVLFDLLGEVSGFSGLNAVAPGAPKKRELTAFSMPYRATGGRALGLNLELRGKLGEDGEFEMKSVEGALHVDAAGASGELRISTLKRLN